MIELLLAVAMSMPSPPLWHGTRYGMSLSQVLSSVPEAHMITPPIVKPIGEERAIAEHLSLDGHEYKAEFWFHSDSLDEVHLVFEPLRLKAGDGEWIKRKLSDKYGQANCLEPPADGICHWNVGSTQVYLITDDDVNGLPMILVSYSKVEQEMGL